MSSVSDSFRVAMDLRGASKTCPPDFAARCAAIPFFGKGARAERFSGLSSEPGVSEDGFIQVQNGRRMGGSSYGGGGSYGGSSYGGSYGGSSYGAASSYGGNEYRREGGPPRRESHQGSRREGGGYGAGSYGGRGYGGSRGGDSRREGYRPPPAAAAAGVPLRSFGRPDAAAAAAAAAAVAVGGAGTEPAAAAAPGTPVAVAVAVAVAETPPTALSVPSAIPFVAFTSAAVRSGASSAVRVAQRAKGKLNRMGFGNYDATKASMREMLDGDEVEFLDDMLSYAFHKAASESLYCALYAKLLHELSTEFPHFRTSMRKLFDDYATIFSEAVAVPESDTEAYKLWLEAQERKKFRRGYSQFVVELVKLGAADTAAFGVLLHNNVSVLESSKEDAKKIQLCEEYGDCLATMCTAAPALLSSASWSPELRRRVEALASYTLTTKPPGFSSRGLFTLQNLVTSAKNGWRPLSV